MADYRKPELLAPGSGVIGVRAAVQGGADAVYVGMGGLNMRAGAKQFTPAQLRKTVVFCHEQGVKVYLTLNTIVYERELARVERNLAKAKEAEVDAVILWDMAVLELARKVKIPIHLSTQASVSNTRAVEFYKAQGVERIILARECSLKEIRNIAKQTEVELETFVHGALCVSLSGRCHLSHQLFKRSANRGDCAQPCRWEYTITDPGKGLGFRLGDGYVLSPKDLCALPFLDRLIKAGISAFKIEGRNRSPEYVKNVTAAYRRTIDDFFDRQLNQKDRAARIDERLESLKAVYNRGFSSGFYLDLPTSDDYTDCYGSKATARKVYVGQVENFYKRPSCAQVKIIAGGGIRQGDKLLFIGHKTGLKEERADSLEIEGQAVTSADKGESVAIKTQAQLRRNDQVYKIVPAKT